MVDGGAETGAVGGQRRGAEYMVETLVAEASAEIVVHLAVQSWGHLVAHVQGVADEGPVGEGGAAHEDHALKVGWGQERTIKKCNVILGKLC